MITRYSNVLDHPCDTGTETSSNFPEYNITKIWTYQY